MRSLQLFLEWSRRPVCRQRTLLPALESLDGRRLPSAVHLIAPAVPAMVVALDSLRLLRLDTKETAYPGHTQAARPHVSPGPILTGALDRGSRPPSTDGGSNDDDGALPGNDTDSDEPKSPFSEMINRPGGMVEKDEVDVELAASSKLLTDEPKGRRRAGLNPEPLIDRAHESGATIRPPSRAAAAGNREPVGAVTDRASRDGYGVHRGSDLVEIERPRTATIAGRSQAADGPGPCPAAAGTGEVGPRTWGIVLAGLASRRPGPRACGG